MEWKKKLEEKKDVAEKVKKKVASAPSGKETVTHKINLFVKENAT